MVGRVVEIATDGRHLSIFRGFIVVNEHGEEVGRIPVDEVAAVIANAHGLTYSNNVLVELSGRGIPVVLCGANHMPAAIVWPVDAHHIQTGRMNDQVAASLPLKKRLWAQLVAQKSRRRARPWRESARRAAVSISYRAKFVQAIPRMWRPSQHGDTGRCSLVQNFAATRTATASTAF